MKPSSFAALGAGRPQRGSTLVIALVFLVIITLVATSAIKSTTVNSKIAGNMQVQHEAVAATQQAIEAVLSSDFTKAPTANTISVDIDDSNRSGSTYAILVAAPVCVGVKPIKLSELDVANANDVPCYASGAAQNTGIVGSGGNGNSLCSQSNWDIGASYTPAGETIPATTTHQGIATRVAVGAAC
jgi:hypothetical protein